MHVLGNLAITAFSAVPLALLLDFHRCGEATMSLTEHMLGTAKSSPRETSVISSLCLDARNAPTRVPLVRPYPTPCMQVITCFFAIILFRQGCDRKPRAEYAMHFECKQREKEAARADECRVRLQLLMRDRLAAGRASKLVEVDSPVVFEMTSAA